MNRDAKGVSIKINVGALESKPSCFFFLRFFFNNFCFLLRPQTYFHSVPDQEIDLSCQDTGLPKAMQWYALVRSYHVMASEMCRSNPRQVVHLPLASLQT